MGISLSPLAGAILLAPPKAARDYISIIASICFQTYYFFIGFLKFRRVSYINILAFIPSGTAARANRRAWQIMEIAMEHYVLVLYGWIRVPEPESGPNCLNPLQPSVLDGAMHQTGSPGVFNKIAEIAEPFRPSLRHRQRQDIHPVCVFQYPRPGQLRGVFKKTRSNPCQHVRLCTTQ